MLGAVLAYDLVLLDIDKDLIRETHMDKGVQAATILLKELSLKRLVWVID